MENIHLKHCKVGFKNETCRFTFEVDNKDEKLKEASGNKKVYFQMLYENNEFTFPQLKEDCSNLWIVKNGEICELPKELYLNRVCRAEAKKIGEEYVGVMLKKDFAIESDKGKYSLNIHTLKDNVITKPKTIRSDLEPQTNERG